MKTEEIQTCVIILATTKLVTSPKGKSELVQLAVEQAELDTDEEPLKDEEPLNIIEE